MPNNEATRAEACVVLSKLSTYQEVGVTESENDTDAEVASGDENKEHGIDGVDEAVEGDEQVEEDEYVPLAEKTRVMDSS